MSIGDYTRNLPANSTELDPLNQRVQASLDGTLDELPDTFENWQAPQVREAVEGLQRADENRTKQRANADAFLASHPEFLDIQANGETMNRTLEALYGERLYTPAEFERAYKVCRANKTLQLDEAELAKQAQAAANARAKAEQKSRAAAARTYTEEELYEMPLEELRQIENRDLQKRQEKIAQEGGWY